MPRGASSPRRRGSASYPSTSSSSRPTASRSATHGCVSSASPTSRSAPICRSRRRERMRPTRAGAGRRPALQLRPARVRSRPDPHRRPRARSREARVLAARDGILRRGVHRRRAPSRLRGRLGDRSSTRATSTARSRARPDSSYRPANGRPGTAAARRCSTGGARQRSSTRRSLVSCSAAGGRPAARASPARQAVRRPASPVGHAARVGARRSSRCAREPTRVRPRTRRPEQRRQSANSSPQNCSCVSDNQLSA